MNLSLIWDIHTESPQLEQSLCESVPNLAETLTTLRTSPPSPPPTNGEFNREKDYRPQGHFRSFYRRLDKGNLALKGLEIACGDQTELLQLMQQRDFERWEYYSCTNVLEYFAIQEHKVPGALTLTEALDEANKALSLQAAFKHRFQEFGAFPFPLFVYQWDKATVEGFLARLSTFMSGYALDIVKREVSSGLAVYVYYLSQEPYPRVAHLSSAIAQRCARESQSGFMNRSIIQTALNDACDVNGVLESVFRQVARILCVGFFPSDVTHFKNGQCIEPQNVLISGGLADMDSVLAFTDIQNDRSFYLNFLALMNLLARLCRTLLLAEGDGTTMPSSNFPAQFAKPDFMDILCTNHAWSRLKRILMEISPTLPSESLDSRLETIINASDDFYKLYDTVLKDIYYTKPSLHDSAKEIVSLIEPYSRE